MYQLTFYEFLKPLDHCFVLAVVLLHRRRVLLPHRINLALDLRLLKQFIDLQVHLLQLANQVEVGLLEAHQVLILPLDLDDPLLLSPCKFHLAYM